MPPNKRLTKYLAWGKVLVYPLQWLHSRLFLDYKEGTIYLDWVVSTAYTKNTFVKYTNKSIYYCIQNHTSSSIITPLDTEYWYKTQDSFIGVTERMKYNSQKIVFEYALNRWFGLTFVQPNAISPIWINTPFIDTNSFLVSSNDENSAYAAYSGTEALQYVGSTYDDTETASFTIHYPSTLPATLGITEAVLKQQISTLADKIKLSGTNYNLISYTP
jgi:hypothetical protein